MTGFSRRTLIGGAMTGALLAGPARAFATAPAPLDEAAIDALATSFRDTFEVPGLAVAIVRPGQPPFAKGYGVRRLGQAAKVDAHTLFGIASNSKAFTAAALALLVDDGKLGWDEPVTKYLPEFQMYDPAVTQMMTVRDLLVHRSGLPLGAGDLMQFPATTHTLADMLHGLRFLKPSAGFRAAYAYDNILYVVAGMLITRVSGLSWEQFVTQRILRPLGMSETVAGFTALAGHANVVGRHARLGPPVRGLGPMKVVQPDEQDKIDAAGGINASAHDIHAWFDVQLARGRLPNGQRLWSEAQSTEMWKPQTITNSGPGPDAEHPTRSVMSGYALGWGVSQYRDQRLLSHSGGLTGQVTQHALLPELGCGVAVYTNEEGSFSSVGLRNALLDRLIGMAPFDWRQAMLKARAAQQADALKESGGGAPVKPAGTASLPLAGYVGRYRDPWYGDVVVSRRDGGLFIDFTRTPVFKSRLEPWGKDAFRTRFDPLAGEDAVVTFAVANGQVTRVTMKPLSPLADFSFDFQHLDFAPVR